MEPQKRAELKTLFESVRRFADAQRPEDDQITILQRRVVIVDYGIAVLKEGPDRYAQSTSLRLRHGWHTCSGVDGESGRNTFSTIKKPVPKGRKSQVADSQKEDYGTENNVLSGFAGPAAFDTII